MEYDIIISQGLYFDGHNNDPMIADLGIKDGFLKAVSKKPLLPGPATQVIDANGLWIMPGFIDIHTHYDVELLVSPGLFESVRHGVTTVVTGNCSLSTIYSTPLDCADMFARVEALPRASVLKTLHTKKDWQTPKEYIGHLSGLALGPNVASFLGHSDLRAHVLGLGRSVDRKTRPSKEERKLLEDLLGLALDAGFIGLSTMTNPWDKLDGDRYLSSSLPSTYASWREYAWLNSLLRKSNRVLQSAPNLNSKVNSLLFFLQSMPLPWRPGLKTTLLSATDLKSSRWLADAYGPVTRGINRFLGSHMKWQAIPVPFEIYADGMELVIFEEFGAGRAALHIRDELQRHDLLKNENYRRAFRKDLDKRFSPRIWHRNFYDTVIISCDDITVVGKSFGVVADEKKLHPCDVFLDLVVEHGSKLRWKTLIANDRPQKLEKLLADDAIHVGFADSGAHLRNMGFYNFPLHFLKLVHDAHQENRPFMALKDAVAKLTRELALWCGIDAGSLKVNDRADVVLIDPLGLDQTLSEYHEEYFAEFDVKRMVRRNDKAVPLTLIKGKIAYKNGQFADDFGKKAYGSFLKA